MLSTDSALYSGPANGLSSFFTISPRFPSIPILVFFQTVPPLTLFRAPRRATHVDEPEQRFSEVSRAVELTLDQRFHDRGNASLQTGDLEGQLNNLNATLGACTVEAEWIAHHLDDGHFEALLAVLSEVGCYELICDLSHAHASLASHLDRAAYICRPGNLFLCCDHRGSDATVVPSALRFASSPNLFGILDARECDLALPHSTNFQLPPRTRWVRIHQEHSKRAQPVASQLGLHGLILEPSEDSP